MSLPIFLLLCGVLLGAAVGLLFHDVPLWTTMGVVATLFTFYWIWRYNLWPTPRVETSSEPERIPATLSPDEERVVRRKYGWRRLGQRVCIGTAFAATILCALFHDEIRRLTHLSDPYILIVLLWAGIFVVFRRAFQCPACGRPLNTIRNPIVCPSCGVRLRN